MRDQFSAKFAGVDRIQIAILMLFAPMRCAHVILAVLAAGILVSISLPLRLLAEPDPGRKNPYAGDANSVATGRELYNANCADCHGATGKGDGKMAKDLKKAPTDLTDPKLATQPDEKLFQQISRGKKPMPSFEKMLNEEQRWHVVSFVRSLSAKK